MISQTLIANGSSAVENWDGGDGTLFAVGPLFGGGVVKLQASIDGTGPWFDCVDLSGAVGTLTTNGILNFQISPCKLRANLSGAAAGGAAQVETATAVGTVTVAGIAIATVTGPGVIGSPLAVPFAVEVGDTPALWAVKARAALNDIPALYRILAFSGAGADIVGTTTAQVHGANDSVISNIALATGTATGITAAPASANTTAGVASVVNLVVKIDRR